MKKLLLVVLLLCPMAHATTWYVRTDGGTKTQCTGTTDAPYPGSGTAQACAVNHLYWLLDQSAWTWLISTNDTIHIGSGAYYMGQQHNGLGQFWSHCVGGEADCYVPPFPDGVSVLGAGAGSCHDGAHNPTPSASLVGIDFLFRMFSLQGTNHVDLECLDITQAATCTSQGKQENIITNTSMTSGVATYTWRYSGSDNRPASGQFVTISGTTNGSGVFNVTNKVLNSLTPSTYAITNTQMTSGTATYTYTLTSGQGPINGDSVIISGTTNGGGVFNSQYGYAITNVTGTTFKVTGLSGTYASQAESGTGQNNDSGQFTIAGLSGTVSSAADSGTQYFAGWCDSPGQSGDYLGNGIVMEYPIAQGPSNATLKDLSIHGLKGTAILGSKFNTAPTDTLTVSDLLIAGNGESGWDADGGNCGASCESQGTMNISYLTAEWNGCVEVHPNGGTIGGNGYNYCVDQAFSGNGDGIVMIATAGTWNWSHGAALYNAQDGFDALHAGDDPVIRPTVNMEFMYAMGNEGQSIKNGGGQATIVNSIGIANCNVFANASNFPLNPLGWNAMAQLRCRANDAIATAMQDGDTLTIENVTNIGEAVVGWDISNANCTSAAKCHVTFKNNTTLGFLAPMNPGNYMGGFTFIGPDIFSDPGSVAANNAWYHIGNSGTTCPSDGYETNAVCTDPQFVSESDINAINAKLTATSSLIGKGVTISGLTKDFGNNTRPSPPSIGAWEFMGAPTSPYVGGSVVFGGSGTF